MKNSHQSIKIVFLGAKEIGYQCLDFLLLQQKELNIQILGLLTNEKKAINQQIISKAKAANIPIFESLEHIPDCDFIISVQYHEILKKEDILKAKLRAINLHLAPLPEYRGCNQFSFAIFNQEQEFGVSLHEINEQVDDGDLIAEFRWKIPLDIWVEDLWKQANKKGFELFKNTFPELLNNPYLSIPKKDKKSYFYFRKDINKLKELKWNESKEVWDRKIRATSMTGFSAPFFYLNGKKVELRAK